MDDAIKAKQLLIGASMKIEAFYGDNQQIADEINKFFRNKNVEIHDVKIESSNKTTSSYHGDMIAVVTYTEIK